MIKTLFVIGVISSGSKVREWHSNIFRAQRLLRRYSHDPQRADITVGVPWSDISRGMHREHSGQSCRNTDELQMRAFWRQWQTDERGMTLPYQSVSQVTATLNPGRRPASAGDSASPAASSGRSSSCNETVTLPGGVGRPRRLLGPEPTHRPLQSPRRRQAGAVADARKNRQKGASPAKKRESVPPTIPHEQRVGARVETSGGGWSIRIGSSQEK
jgi:hypothetical protein